MVQIGVPLTGMIISLSSPLLSSPLLSIPLIKACVSGGRPEVMERLSITLTSLRLISYKICFLYL
jgi:hypothetical protein